MYHAAQHDDKGVGALAFRGERHGDDGRESDGVQYGDDRNQRAVSVGRIRRMRDDEGCQLVAGQSGERPRAQSQSVHGGH